MVLLAIENPLRILPLMREATRVQIAVVMAASNSRDHLFVVRPLVAAKLSASHLRHMPA